MKRIALVVGLVLCVMAMAVAWVRWTAPSRRNVVLITIDTQRADRISAYGYTEHQTPNLDRLAKEGVLFENAFCDVTWTTPSMASVMTGRYATVHGLRTSYQRLSPKATTLAETLHEQGRATAAILGSFPLDSMFGLDQGFDLYDDRFSLPLLVMETPLPTPAPTGELGRMRQKLFDRAINDAYRPDNEVSDRVIRWLREERRDPFFLWAHYLGPHEKPQPGTDEAERKRRQLAQYDPDTVIADAQVGRVLDTLDELGLTEETLVIVHADHGQSLTEHSYFGHGRYLYDPVQRIPMIMRLPGVIPAGARVTRMVRNIDIFPTVLAATGIPPTMPLDGIDLLPVVTGEDFGGPEEMYIETYLSTLQLFVELVAGAKKIPLGFRRLGMRTADWKFVISDPYEIMDIDNPRPVTDEMRKQFYYEELFDLRTDPGENHDVIDENRELAARFLERVWEFQQLAGPQQSEERGLTEGQRERLRSLGYMLE